MKAIALLSHVFAETTGTVPLDMEAAVGLTKAVQENRKKVIVAGLFVERELEAIVGFYLFPGPAVTDQQAFVAGEILGSNAVSFEHKCRLVKSLTHKLGWLDGQEKAAFEKRLGWMVRRRNAFTHGNIVIRDGTAFLEYFEGQRQKVELTDAYWTELESTFTALVAQIEAVKKAAGMQ